MHIVTLLFFLRYISDYFWEYKITSVISIVFVLAVSLSILYRDLYFNRINKPWLERSHLYILLLLLLFFYNFITDYNAISLAIMIKVLSSIVCFYLGLKLKINDFSNQALFFLPVVAIVILVMFSGGGYQYWGDYNTFSGGYYFKTDVALAMTIFFIFASVSKINRNIVLFIVIPICAYVIYKSNARAYYFVYFIVIMFYLLDDKIFKFLNDIKKFILFTVSLSFIIILVFYYLSSFISSDYLFIDFSSGFSDANLQGRNIIWETLLNYYVYEASIWCKLVGSGLSFDSNYANLIFGGDFTHNAHNTYIYVLISNGILGFIFFMLFLYYVMARLVYLSNRDMNKNQKEILYVLLSLFTIFTISSLSNVTLIYNQLTWFFMLFSGLLWNKKVFN
jgi:O-antigen ligase